MGIAGLVEGDAIRCNNWTHCILELDGIAGQSFFGVLKDQKTNRVIMPFFTVPLHYHWEKVLSVEDILSV